MADNACELIRRSKLERVVVTNTIQLSDSCKDHKIIIEPIDWLIGEAIRRTHEGSSISTLFQAPRYRQEPLIPSERTPNRRDAAGRHGDNGGDVGGG
jgi:hypothetical protein